MTPRHHLLHRHLLPHQVTPILYFYPPATSPPPLRVTPTSNMGPPAISLRVVLLHLQAAGKFSIIKVSLMEYSIKKIFCK